MNGDSMVRWRADLFIYGMKAKENDWIYSLWVLNHKNGQTNNATLEWRMKKKEQERQKMRKKTKTACDISFWNGGNLEQWYFSHIACYGASLLTSRCFIVLFFRASNVCLLVFVVFGKQSQQFANTNYDYHHRWPTTVAADHILERISKPYNIYID